MPLLTLPGHLRRYAGMARLWLRYADRDLLAHGRDAEHDTHRHPPEQLALDLERMGPAYVKLGQLLSTRSDLLPAPYIDALARLQDRAKPFAFDRVERIVQRELGCRLSKAFTWFEREPYAAASLGQVHRARLRSGLKVAVKVQRPDVREQVTGDLAAFASVAEFLDRHAASPVLSFAEIVEEFRRTILEELDYRREAQNLKLIAKHLASFDRLVIPAPVDDYSTDRVLTMEFVEGTKITALNPVVRLDLEPAQLVEQLFAAYLRQVLIDGCFHADPHPGNVLVTDDGRLALIDLGMVSRVRPSDQDQLLKLLLAVAEGRGDQAAHVAIALGRQTEQFDRAGLETDVTELVAQYRDADLQHLHAGTVVMELSRLSAAHGLRMPTQLAMLGRTLFSLDNVARTLAPQFNAQESIRRNASAVLRERMRRSVSVSGGVAALMELRAFAEALPERLNRVLHAVSSNELKLKMEVIDEGALIEGFQKVANRIALGLVLAALIVGAAMLMQVPAPFTILGYPGIAMLLFLAAASGGIWMAISILTGDRRAHHR